jgi:hypothetical protein
MSYRVFLVALCCLFISVSATTVVGQTLSQQTSPASQGIEVGASFGLIWVPEIMSLRNMGAFASMRLNDHIALKVAYSHAGVALLGFELLGIDFLEASLVLDVASTRPFGAFVLGGGTYILTSALGEGGSGVAILAGVGIRLTPVEFMTIRVGYVARIKYGVLHGGAAEVSIRF